MAVDAPFAGSAQNSVGSRHMRRAETPSAATPHGSSSGKTQSFALQTFPLTQHLRRATAASSLISGSTLPQKPSAAAGNFDMAGTMQIATVLPSSKGLKRT